MISYWLLVISFSSLWAEWEKEVIYSGEEKPIHLVLGKGRNDDTVRIYWTSDDFLLREATYRNGVWDIDTLGPGIGSIVIAPGRNDGVNRVYTSKERFLREYTWSGGKWKREDWELPFPIWKFTSGKLHNDNMIRFYCVRPPDEYYNPILYELTFESSIWRPTVVDTPYHDPGALMVARGRNDDTSRIYLHSIDDIGWPVSFFEFTFSQDSWRMEYWRCVWGDTLDFPGAFFIGDGRGDGINRIYASASLHAPGGLQEGYLYEISWADSLWDCSSIYWTIEGGIGGINAGEGRGDDTVRLYFNNHDIVAFGLHEYTYSPFQQKWRDEIVIDRPVSSISFGKTKYDDITRIYGILDTSIIELAWSSKGIEEKVCGLCLKNIGLKVEPNPTRGRIDIIFQIPEKKRVNLKIYDASGRLVETLINDRQRAGYWTAAWASEKAGVYFCRLEIEGKTITKKVVVLK